MIFVTGKDGSMFLMLSEKDIETMRAGNTKFVDERQTKGVTFNRVILSLHKTDEEAVAILRGAGHAVPPPGDLEKPMPRAHEVRCPGCDGIIDNGSIFEGRCIVCWANAAKNAVAQEDGQHRRRS